LQTESDGDATRAPGAEDNDETGLPPFVSTWGGFYRLVVGVLLALILAFYCIQAYFA
jgi:hypothetical protein